ncbi:hypothetical protein LC040_15385 [Bacillus tianshenii]|nr:hypothetical protein LC040_15385 [Bacillus tianshenii]
MKFETEKGAAEFKVINPPRMNEIEQVVTFSEQNSLQSQLDTLSLQMVRLLEKQYDLERRIASPSD